MQKKYALKTKSGVAFVYAVVHDQQQRVRRIARYAFLSFGYKGLIYRKSRKKKLAKRGLLLMGTAKRVAQIIRIVNTAGILTMTTCANYFVAFYAQDVT